MRSPTPPGAIRSAGASGDTRALVVLLTNNSAGVGAPVADAGLFCGGW